VRRLLPLLGAGFALACAGFGRGPAFATSERFPDLPRKPPTFAAETTPVSLEDAPSSRPGHEAAPLDQSFAIQVAVMPLDSEAARDLVSRFFSAVLLESTRELFPLLGSQAWVVSEGSRQPAQAVWRARFAQLDYTSLAGRVVAPPQTLHTYTFASAERAERDGVPTPQTPSEVVVVARPGLSWAGKTRLFGDQLAFRLLPKRDEPGYEITEILEDFRLP
jgi:hypothetical protein